MADPTLQDQVDAARAYEALFVPALFGQWAPLVAAAAHIRPGQRVLDVACGTGALARAVHPRTGPGGLVVGLDPDPGMLAVARELAPAINWRQGTAEAIPFADASFDAVVSQFGLMFFTDRRRALREKLRVLIPGGHLAVAVWDSLASMPAYAREVALLERLAGRQAADALRAPFVLGDGEELARMLKDAGAVSVAVTTRRGMARIRTVRAMVEADLRGWLPVMGAILTEDQIAHILEKAGEELCEFAGPDGQVEFEIRTHVLKASKPRQSGERAARSSR